MTTKLFLGNIQIHSKLLSRGFCHIFCTNAENRFFERSCYFFKFSVRSIFQLKLIDLVFKVMINVHSLFQVLFLFYCIFSTTKNKIKMIYHLNTPCPPCPARHKARHSNQYYKPKSQKHIFIQIYIKHLNCGLIFRLMHCQPT